MHLPAERATDRYKTVSNPLFTYFEDCYLELLQFSDRYVFIEWSDDVALLIPPPSRSATRIARGFPPEAAGIFIYFMPYQLDDVFMTNGLPPPAPVLIHTLLVCRYSLIASMPFSRPRPELL